MVSLIDPCLHETSGSPWVARIEKLGNHARFSAESIGQLVYPHELARVNFLFSLLHLSINM